MQAATTSLQGMGAAATTAGTGLRGVNTNAGNAAGSRRMAGTAVGIGLLMKGLQGIGDVLKDARDFARDAAKENLKLQDSLRELAAL